MIGKKTGTPTVRINERAPKEKWMRDANVVPSPVHQQSGIVDGADIYRRHQQEKAQRIAQGEEVGQPAPDSPDIFDGANAMALERRTAAAAAEQSRADTLEAEKVLLEEKLSLTEKSLSEVQSNTSDLRSQTKKLRKELAAEKAKIAPIEKQLKESQEDRRSEAAEYVGGISKLQARVKELESAPPSEPEEVEVEVYPDRIVVDEITNTIRKGATIILKTQVKMDDEMVPMTIRAPFKKMKAAVDRGERAPKNEDGDEE